MDQGKPHIFFSAGRWLCGHGFYKCSGQSPMHAYRFWQTVQQSKIDYLKKHLQWINTANNLTLPDGLIIRYHKPSPAAPAAKD